MYDLLTLTAIVDELSEHLIEGRVQVVGLRDRSTVVMEIYAQRRRWTLVAAIGGREPACYLASEDLRPDAEIVTPFSLLMRKYLRGALLVAIDQPPFDRIIRLSFAKLAGDLDDIERDNDELGDASEIIHTSLSIELMGRRSNVVLVDNDGVVMDSLKRVTPHMSGVRPVLPRRPYELPPSGDRIDPRHAIAEAIRAALTEQRPGETLAARLVRAVAGLSPQMAREVLFQATGNAEIPAGALDAPSAQRIAQELRSLFEHMLTGQWHPVMYQDAMEDVVAYAAMPQMHLRQSGLVETEAASISQAVETYLGGVSSGGRHAGRRDRLLRAIEAASKRSRAKLQALQEEQQALEDGDRFRRWGEAIFANLWAIQPYQEELEWEGERIPLDPGKPPSELAQEYFSRYRKAGRGREQLEELINQANNEVLYLDQLTTLASMAETFEEIEALRREWERHPLSTHVRPTAKGPARQRKPAMPKPAYDKRGNAIYVGRSGEANDLVTFTIAGPDDYWLHARGVPGAHVVLRPLPGRDVTEGDLEEAASLAAYYSSARESGLVEVDICRRRDVRKIKGAGPGMVTYRNERTVRVPSRSELSLASHPPDASERSAPERD